MPFAAPPVAPFPDPPPAAAPFPPIPPRTVVTELALVSAFFALIRKSPSASPPTPPLPFVVPPFPPGPPLPPRVLRIRRCPRRRLHRAPVLPARRRVPRRIRGRLGSCFRQSRRSLRPSR